MLLKLANNKDHLISQREIVKEHPLKSSQLLRFAAIRFGPGIPVTACSGLATIIGSQIVLH